MRLSHFHALRPVCPACRLQGALAPLTLACVEEERDEVVRSGVLGCEACGNRYPILDGLPVLVPDLPRFLSDNLFYLTMRRDLTPGVTALLAEATGPGAGIDAIRQHVSSYGWDHWADQDPAEAGGEQVEPGQVSRVLAQLLDGLPAPLPDGPILDLGCGAGRTTADLAERTGQLVLGVDLSVPLARVAWDAVVGGHVAYERRRAGLHFERRSFSVRAEGKADIWIADALGNPQIARDEVPAFVNRMTNKRRAGYIELQHEGRSGVFQLRGGCCLNYRIPGNEKCDTCSLRPMDERITIFRGLLANGAPAH